ncbi:hypothetical protein [Allokutzneria albata]|uniref:DUF2127 domain-containing protein n=1 Tax=Allokutzneria albata TaxID=211114 RepID=A0A1G9Z4T6_ALLAB|nr:hypothetical protein [Allokutzneria albata]SDN16217.1 hypothetical protein SAMN04489726_5259 [Allokutzneria albata]
MNKDSAASAKSVRTAVAVWLALATFCTLDVLITWLEHARLRQAVVDQGLATPDNVDAVLDRALWQKTVFQLVFAVAYILLALLLRRGHAWTRVALITVSVFQVFMLFTWGGLGPVLILILVLATGGLMLTWRQATTDWLASVRDER